jgi:hypothetical protein
MKEFTMRFFSFVVLALLLSSGFAGENRLPRVLILGDSIYGHPSQQVARLLAGRAEVVFSGTKSWHVFNTTTACAHLDEVLGDGKWDVIHFNFGLAELSCGGDAGRGRLRRLPRRG